MRIHAASSHHKERVRLAPHILRSHCSICTGGYMYEGDMYTVGRPPVASRGQTFPVPGAGVRCEYTRPARTTRSASGWPHTSSGVTAAFVQVDTCMKVTCTQWEGHRLRLEAKPSLSQVLVSDANTRGQLAPQGARQAGPTHPQESLQHLYRWIHV